MLSFMGTSVLTLFGSIVLNQFIDLGRYCWIKLGPALPLLNIPTFFIT